MNRILHAAGTYVANGHRSGFADEEDGVVFLLRLQEDAYFRTKGREGNVASAAVLVDEIQDGVDEKIRIYRGRVPPLILSFP